MSRASTVEARHDLSAFVDSLRARATSHQGIPASVAAEAAAVAFRRFGREFDCELRASERARVAAYFRGVLRRRAIASRGPELKALRSRYLLASLAEDLKVTGRSGREIYLEIAQDHAAHVDRDALRALEIKLCGGVALLDHR